jgi:hypothetical protein
MTTDGRVAAGLGQERPEVHVSRDEHPVVGARELKHLRVAGPLHPDVAKVDGIVGCIGEGLSEVG